MNSVCQGLRGDFEKGIGCLFPRMEIRVCEKIKQCRNSRRSFRAKFTQGGRCHGPVKWGNRPRKVGTLDRPSQSWHHQVRFEFEFAQGVAGLAVRALVGEALDEQGDGWASVGCQQSNVACTHSAHFHFWAAQVGHEQGKHFGVHSDLRQRVGCLPSADGGAAIGGKANQLRKGRLRIPAEYAEGVYCAIGKLHLFIRGQPDLNPPMRLELFDRSSQTWSCREFALDSALQAPRLVLNPPQQERNGVGSNLADRVPSLFLSGTTTLHIEPQPLAQFSATIGRLARWDERHDYRAGQQSCGKQQENVTALAHGLGMMRPAQLEATGKNDAKEANSQ